MRTMLDACVLRAGYPAVEVIAGYLQSPGTDCAWTAEEWAQARLLADYILPIWVAPDGQDKLAGIAHGTTTVHDCLNLGIAKGSTVALDLEQNRVTHDTQSGYAKAWCDTVSEGGYLPLIYSSASSKPLVAGIAPLWLAKWGEPPALLPDSVATQYEGGTGNGYDLSVVADELVLHSTGKGAGSVPTPSTSPMRGLVRTKTGNGYWTYNAEGAVFAFGDAAYHGGANSPDVSSGEIVGMDSTPDDQGYWLVAADGGVFAYGSAKFHGAVVNGALKIPK